MPGGGGQLMPQGPISPKLRGTAQAPPADALPDQLDPACTCPFRPQALQEPRPPGPPSPTSVSWQDPRWAGTSFPMAVRARRTVDVGRDLPEDGEIRVVDDPPEDPLHPPLIVDEDGLLGHPEGHDPHGQQEEEKEDILHLRGQGDSRLQPHTLTAHRWAPVCPAAEGDSIDAHGMDA